MIIYNNIKNKISKILRPKGKYSFLSTLCNRAEIFDIGCGNNSAYKIKCSFPNFIYTGIDIGEVDLEKPNSADYFISTSPSEFSSEIARFKNIFDAVVSSHNLEHCDKRIETINAMLDSIKPGGVIYMSFPCESSINFPKRYGTLNYYDDPTHQYGPPDLMQCVSILKSKGFEITYLSKRYKPFLLFLIGFLMEPFSIIKKRVFFGTWEYHGFESIIWAKKY